MADYRNYNIKFLIGGVNVAAPPELLDQGQLRRCLNLRPNTEGVIEGRPLSASAKIPQITQEGHEYTYPNNWSTGPLQAMKYIGSVTVNSVNTAAGYISIHKATPLPSGFSDSGYRVFLSGGVIRKQTGYSTFDALAPTSYNIVRANASNGLPIILLDGQWYILNSALSLDSPTTTLSINSGYYTFSAVPSFTAKRLGIPKPASAPTTTTNSTGLTGDYYYRISGYDSATGFQGPPSAVSAKQTLANQGARVSWTDTNTYGNFDFYRVWRLGGSLANTWRLLGTTASTNSGGAVTYDDTAADSTVALNEALDTDSVEVFNTINTSGAMSVAQKFLYPFGPYLGKYVFWVGDPVRKNYIYWNKLADLSRHDPSFDVNAVSDPSEVLINGFIFGNNPFVMSARKLYALDFNGQDALPPFIPREVPIGVGLAGRYSYAVAPNIVYICSKDGIYATDCQSETPRNITDATLKPLFRGEAVENFESVDYTRSDEIRMEATNKEVHFLYPGMQTGQMQHLVYDVEKDRWLQWTSGETGLVYANEGVSWNQLFLGNSNDQLVRVVDDVIENEDESYQAVFRSGSVDAGAPLTFKEWGQLIFDYEPAQCDISITPYYDSEVNVGTTILTGTQGQAGRRVDSFSLDEYYARNIALQFTWQEEPDKHPKLYQALILYREDEEEVLEWEHPPQSLGQGGIYHIKDSFWGLRTNAPVSLTVSVDGHEDLYNHVFEDTNNTRQKLYLEFLPRLGTVWGFKLTSAEPFRFYGEDTVLSAKPWQTDSGYQALTPFSQAGYAAYLRKGGGT